MTLLSCSRTAPNPTALASVCTTNEGAPTLNWGYTKSVACVSLDFSVVNAVAHACIHTKGVFLCQIMQGGSNFSKILYISSIVGHKTNELSKCGYVCWGWPVLNTGDFLGIWLHTCSCKDMP